MTAPRRILAWPWEVNPSMGQWEAEQSIVGDGYPYILATPDALSRAPEVQALIRAAVEAERERCLRVVTVTAQMLRGAAHDLSGKQGAKEIFVALDLVIEEVAAAIRKGE